VIDEIEIREVEHILPATRRKVVDGGRRARVGGVERENGMAGIAATAC